jgi:hypothetical protein
MWALEMALSPASISPQRIDEKQQLTATKGVTGAITILRAAKAVKRGTYDPHILSCMSYDESSATGHVLQ